MSKGRRRRKPFRQQQDFVHRFAFGELLDGAPFVEQARRRADDVFADGFEQEMHRLRHAGVFRANGHDERARFLNDAPRPPVGVRFAMAHGRLRIEMAAHRLDVFLPGIVVQDEIAEARMTFKVQAKQILGFALVPVRRVNEFDDARKSFLGERRGRPAHGPSRPRVRRKRQ